MQFRLSKEDSADIGFALACLTGGAIHFREFKEWLFHVIKHCDDPPAYIFDMLDVKDRRDFRALEIMRFVGISKLTNADYDAIAGVRFLRGISDFENLVGADSNKDRSPTCGPRLNPRRCAKDLLHWGQSDLTGPPHVCATWPSDHLHETHRSDGCFLL